MTHIARLRALLPILALLLVLAPAATGAVTAKPQVTSSAGVARVEVALTGATGRSAATAVTVTIGTRRFVLVKRTAARWRSAPFRGRAAAGVLALAGRRAVVRVRTRAGVRVLRAPLAAPATAPATPGAPGTTPTTPGPGGATPLFAAPAQELTGNDAFNHFSRYLLNARFTDYVPGWPNCAVEQRYVHCTTGAWEYHRYTPTSGADINSYGSFSITGAVARTDGSWGVEYIVSAYGNQYFYSWQIAANGTVTGQYWAAGNAPPNPPNEILGPFAWAQPAGGC